MAKIINWRQFLFTPEQGGGTLSCAVSGITDGKISGLLRLGPRADTTILMISENQKTPVAVHVIHCSATGCETSETIPSVKERYRIPLSRGKHVVIGVQRPSGNRMSVIVHGNPVRSLHYCADRNTVTLGDEAHPASLMRGGTKTRVGRAFGYGIFATEDIKSGEIVEEAPMLTQDAPFLSNYTFSMGDKHVLPLGNLALYNHSDNPSCNHTIDESASVMILTATRDIKAGEPLSISYGEMWFVSRGLVAEPLTSDI